MIVLVTVVSKEGAEKTERFDLEQGNGLNAYQVLLLLKGALIQFGLLK